MTHDFSAQLKIGEKYEEILDRNFSDYYHYRVKKATDRQQRQGIDRIFQPEPGFTIDGYYDEEEEPGSFTVEYKTDLRAHITGNAFIETVSVDKSNTPGWAYTSKASVLVYYIPQRGICYLISLDHLRRKLPEWKQKYPERKVKNSDYYTHGLLVPLPEFIDQSYWEYVITP